MSFEETPLVAEDPRYQHDAMPPEAWPLLHTSRFVIKSDENPYKQR